MNDILPLVQKVVRHELQKLRVGELGVVTSVFPHTGKDDYNNYECNVKLKNSAVNGSELELRKVPIATGVIGMAAAPNVGDLVLIAFIRGEVNQPIITGRLYNDEDRPPVHTSNEFIHRLPLQEEENKTLKLELRNIQKNDPPREFLVSMPERVTLQVNDKQVLGEVDKTRVRINQPGGSDGVITVESGKSRFTINQDGDISVESEGKLSFSSRGDMSFQAPNITMKSDQALSLEAGTDGTFKTGAKATIDSSAPLSVKSSATAKIEAGATMDIKGAMVNIN